MTSAFDRLLSVSLLGLAAPALLFGCGGEDGRPPLATLAVGPSGGVLSAPGIALGIPEGAIGTVREISVFEAEAPAGLDHLLTPVFRFEPAGTVFDAPVLVNIEVPDGAIGQVLWTRPGSQTEFERVGHAFDGRGRAWVTHFSQATVEGSCTPAVQTQDCECLAQDMAGGTLCSSAPPDECITRYRGFPDGNCNGYGERPEYTIRCYCAGMGNSQLCPVPQDFPSESCPGGARLYAGADMDSCYGYYVATDVNGVKYAQGTSGMMHSCLTVEDGTVWRLVPGRLSSCMPLMDGPAAPMMWAPPMAGAGGSPEILEEPTTESDTAFECADTEVGTPPAPPMPPPMMPPPMMPPPMGPPGS